MKKYLHRLLAVTTLALTALAAVAQETNSSSRARWTNDNDYLRKKPEWYSSAEARAVADSVLQYQSSRGAWPKNTDLTRPVTAEISAQIESGGKANTIDNGGTTVPLRFMALMAHATGEARYKESFARGLDYLFAAQYPNGGWPQFFPLREGYYSHITYNDNAMMNVMFLLRDTASGQAPYDFVDAERRKRAAAAVTRGVDCILKTQVKQDGKLTVWCAQHDEKTFAPVWARNFEPPTLSGNESVAIVRFLMEIEPSTPEISAAIEGAVAWFKTAAIPGLRYHRGMAADGQRDGQITPDATAAPIWARFYELGSNRPVFVGRDKETNYAYEKIERERRGGYDYYGDWPARLLEKDYPQWQARNKTAPAAALKK